MAKEANGGKPTPRRKPSVPGSETPGPAAADDAEAAPPTFSESLAAAAKHSGFGQLRPGETPNARALLAAIGGVRGVIESVLPGIAFLVLYLTTYNLLVSVLVPVALVFGFAITRAGSKSTLSSTITGAVLLAISAVLVLITGRAVTNFVPGIIINAAGFLVVLVSILVRWPIVGIIVGLLFGDPEGWRKDVVKRRMLTIASWLWVGLFAIRLILEVPLYFANNVAALGVVRLITSVPLYALVLWVTWLLVRGIYTGDGGGTTEISDPSVEDEGA